MGQGPSPGVGAGLKGSHGAGCSVCSDTALRHGNLFCSAGDCQIKNPLVEISMKNKHNL